MKKVDNFNPGKWLVENKITTQSRLNKDGKIDEFGPMYGSQNKSSNVSNPLVKIISNLDRILNDITKTPFKASMEWDVKSEELLGENNYWNQLDDSELEEAINIAKNILSKYNIYYNKKNINL